MVIEGCYGLCSICMVCGGLLCSIGAIVSVWKDLLPKNSSPNAVLLQEYAPPPSFLSVLAASSSFLGSSEEVDRQSLLV